jgi:hypothetical protein
MNARLLLILLCSPNVVFADIEMKFSDGSSFLVGNGRVMFGDDDNAVLYEPGRKGLVVLNREEKSWLEMAPGFAGDVAERMAEQMEKMLADLPPEQRAMVQQSMPDVAAPKELQRTQFTVRNTGKQDEVAGFECREAEISTDDGLAEEIVCIASAEELGIDDEDYAALSDFMNSLSELASASPDEEPLVDFSVLGGIPIRSEIVEFGDLSELISVDTSSVDTDRLRIPSDYAEVSMDQVVGE